MARLDSSGAGGFQPLAPSCEPAGSPAAKPATEGDSEEVSVGFERQPTKSPSNPKENKPAVFGSKLHPSIEGY
jgi:hypothetical protein